MSHLPSAQADGYSDEAPTDAQVNDYMTLALHIVQGIKAMQEDR